jgi:hypothetical protein
MSWLYSRALVAAFSEANSSAGKPSALSSASPTPQAYLLLDRVTAFSRLSRFGMTFALLTDDHGAELLTWFLEAFPVRTSAQPERAQELTEPEAVSGKKWHESFARWDRDSRSWKTPQCSLLEGWDKFSEIWPRWGMMQNGACSVLPMSARLTSEIGSGSWPSVEMWPTPTVSEATKIPATANYGQVGLNNHPRIRGYPTRDKMPKKKWTTPTAHNARESGYPAEYNRATPTLAASANGGPTIRQMPLNPAWVEWLMGWPLGWTDLKPLETDKFQQWLRQHGKY